MAWEFELYRALLFLHILGVFVFLLGHGASASVGFRLRSEQDPERLRVLLDLSGASYRAFSVGFVWILATGTALGVLVEAWRMAWFWIGLALLFVIAGVMTPLVVIPYNRVRRALGLRPPFQGRRPPKGPTPAIDEITSILEEARPVLASAIGMGGLAVILFLMVFKPF